MNSKKTFTELILPFLIAFVPTSISYIAFKYISTNNDIEKELLLVFDVYVISFILIFLIYHFHGRIFGRMYRKYEGMWMQYIPDFDKKIAVCELYYYGGTYHFSGTNYGSDENDYTMFETSMFVGNGASSFYYITTAHDHLKPEEIEGFGKVYNISKQRSNVYEARGFFFDVRNADRPTHEKALQRTFLFKIDDDFIRHHKIHGSIYDKRNCIIKRIFNCNGKYCRIKKKARNEIYNEYGKYIEEYCRTKFLSDRGNYGPFGSV